MMGGEGKRSKDKGYKGEKEVEAMLRRDGLDAERVPLSGSAGGKWSGDVKVCLDGVEKLVSVKRRKRVAHEGWLGDYDLLFARSDGDTGGWLVSMRYQDWLELVRKAGSRLSNAQIEEAVEYVLSDLLDGSSTSSPEARRVVAERVAEYLEDEPRIPRKAPLVQYKGEGYHGKSKKE